MRQQSYYFRINFVIPEEDFGIKVLIVDNEATMHTNKQMVGDRGVDYYQSIINVLMKVFLSNF